MKRTGFLLSTMTCFFLCLPNVQPLEETHQELLNTVEDVLKKKSDGLVDDDGVMYALVNIIDSNESKNDSNGKLICELLDKQVSILEKVESQTNKGKSRLRIKVNLFLVLKLLCLVGVIYCIWAYKLYQPLLDVFKNVFKKIVNLLEKIINLLAPILDLLKEWLQWLRGFGKSKASADGTKQSEKESKQNVSSNAQEKADTAKHSKKDSESAVHAGSSSPVEELAKELEKKIEEHKQLLGLKEMSHVSHEEVQAALAQHTEMFALQDYIDTTRESEKYSKSAAHAGSSSSFDNPSHHANGSARVFDGPIITSYTIKHILYEDLAKELEKKIEEHKQLLGLEEMSHISHEEVQVALARHAEMFTLQNYIDYSKHIREGLSSESKAILDQNA